MALVFVVRAEAGGVGALIPDALLENRNLGEPQQRALTLVLRVRSAPLARLSLPSFRDLLTPVPQCF